MAHYSAMTVAALAAVMLFGGALPAAAAEPQPDTAAVTASESAAAEGGWEFRNGKQYYIYSDGTAAVGEVSIGGMPYLFGFSGALKTDWQTVDGRRYYYDPASGEPVFGWIEYFDNTYYVSPETGKVTGFCDIADKHYAFSEDGVLLTGEFYDGDVRYFADPETGELHSAAYVYGGDTILTDENGAVAVGWYELEDARRFYIDPDTGEAVYGLTCIDSDVYFITPEEGVIRGTTEIGDLPCHFDEETGARTSGWFEYQDASYYFDPETQSVLFAVFAEIDGNTYYFHENGTMATGLTEIDGSLYYFNPEGILETGAVTIDGVGYYFGGDGKAVTGWLTIGSTVRYFGASGAMVTGWATIDDVQYLFAADGSLCKGLTESDGSLYCFDENGRMQTGWLQIDGEDRYFRPNGQMAVSARILIDGSVCSFDENGVMIAQEEIPDVLDVVDYKQKDPLWANEKLGVYSTIGKEGCLVTSMAMLHSYTTCEEVTPVNMRDMLKFTSGGALASWDLISDLGYTVENVSGSISSTVMRHIYEILRTGCPVVFGSKKGSGQHYVIITGYTGDGVNFKSSDFTINDPGYSKRFTLADHLAEYGTLYKLVY